MPTHQFSFSLSVPYFEDRQRLFFLRRLVHQNLLLRCWCVFRSQVGSRHAIVYRGLGSPQRAHISALLIVCCFSNFAWREPSIGGDIFCRNSTGRLTMVSRGHAASHVLTTVFLKEPLADGPHTLSPVCGSS